MTRPQEQHAGDAKDEITATQSKVSDRNVCHWTANGRSTPPFPGPWGRENSLTTDALDLSRHHRKNFERQPSGTIPGNATPPSVPSTSTTNGQTFMCLARVRAHPRVVHNTRASRARILHARGCARDMRMTGESASGLTRLGCWVAGGGGCSWFVGSAGCCRGCWSESFGALWARCGMLRTRCRSLALPHLRFASACPHCGFGLFLTLGCCLGARVLLARGRVRGSAFELCQGFLKMPAESLTRVRRACTVITSDAANRRAAQRGNDESVRCCWSADCCAALGCSA